VGVEVGVVDRGTALAGVEAAGEQRVGAEFGRASVELAGVAEDQSARPWRDWTMPRTWMFMSR